jgi:hypothetical protein
VIAPDVCSRIRMILEQDDELHAQLLACFPRQIMRLQECELKARYCDVKLQECSSRTGTTCATCSRSSATITAAARLLSVDDTTVSRRLSATTGCIRLDTILPAARREIEAHRKR